MNQNKNTVWNWNTERFNENNFLNLPEMVANTFAKRMWGKGWYFSSTNSTIKKHLQELENSNDLLKIFYSMEKNCSAWGGSIMTLDRLEGGKITIGLSQWFTNSQVAEIHSEEELAVVWSTDGTSGEARYLRTTYKPNETTREYVESLNRSAQVMGANVELLKKNSLPAIETHNLGFVPVVFLRNLPKNNQFGGQIGEWYPDSTPVKSLEELMNYIIKILKKEAEFNRTRVFADLTQQEMNKMIALTNTIDDKDKASRIKSLIGDFIITTNLKAVEGAGGQKAIEILQGDPKFDKYTELLMWIKDQYFIGCGLGKESNSEISKSNLEMQFQNSDEDNTLNMKKTYRQKQLKRLFDKYLMILGVFKEQLSEYSFEIRDNSAKDDIQLVEREMLKVNQGLSSIVRAYMKINGVSMEEAKNALTEIKLEQKEFSSIGENEEDFKNIMNDEEKQEDIEKDK